MSAGRKNEFLSCDWGTSSFRLRLVSRGTVLDEYKDQAGCKSIFETHAPERRAEGFASQLSKAISKIPLNGNQVPLVISGMASSTIGWVQLPYAKLPLRLDGSNLVVQNATWKAPEVVGPTYLVSGAASENEMMRGEESETIGLMQFASYGPQNVQIILPGTHSKHLTVESGAITEIRTYMTGELHEVLSRNSVLRASVAPMTASLKPAFIEGVEYVAKNGLPGSLFQTRTRHVLRKQSPESNTAFLSGLLIGAELLSTVHRQATLPIFLGGTGVVRDLYEQAAETLKFKLARVFSDAETQLAVPRAHELILTHLTA